MWSARVNILAKLKFFPLLKQKYANFFPVFLANIVKNLHGISKMAQSAEIYLLNCAWNCVKKWKNFRRFTPFGRCQEDFHRCWREKQGRNWHIFVSGGGKIGTFGQNIYPCMTCCRKFMPLSEDHNYLNNEGKI